jgi:hypothetical protein
MRRHFPAFAMEKWGQSEPLDLAPDLRLLPRYSIVSTGWAGPTLIGLLITAE